MKAIQISKNGGPEVLELKDISLEKPNVDEVTIEHKAIGLNYIDTYHRSGLYPLKLPTGIGAEGAGLITEIGSNIKDFKVNLRGEITLVLSEKLKDESNTYLDEKDKSKIRKLMKRLSIKDIVTEIKKNKDISKKEIYKYCLDLKNEK